VAGVRAGWLVVGVTLSEAHRDELTNGSHIPSDVAEERGYRSLSWSPEDRTDQHWLRQQRFPVWVRDSDYGSGLLIPMYSPLGELIGGQLKPPEPVPGPDGRLRKYASPVGRSNRIDVHPRNWGRVADPDVPLIIIEGIKKADALAGAGACAIALTGVSNFRNKFRTLPDWEDVPLRDREVIVCFDADARDNPQVARMMGRFGRWLRGKGARVRYLIVPTEVTR
jgi:hypothetical protein